MVKDINEAYKITENKANNEQDKDKKEMHLKMLAKVKNSLEKYTSLTDRSENSLKEMKVELLTNSNEVLSTWLDKSKGKEVTDNSIFVQVPRFYEGEFHRDMAALNVCVNII